MRDSFRMSDPTRNGQFMRLWDDPAEVRPFTDPLQSKRGKPKITIEEARRLIEVVAKIRTSR